MRKFGIIPGSPLLLDEQAELIVTGAIAEIVSELLEQGVATPCSVENRTHCKVYAYNICKDHVHIVIECKSEDLPGTIRLIKGKSSQKYREYQGIKSGKEFHLWAQKYNKWLIQSDEQFRNTVAYIIRNRLKHGLPENRGLKPLVLKMIQNCGDEEFSVEYGNEIDHLYR